MGWDVCLCGRVVQVQWFFKTRNGGGDEMFLHSIPISFKVEEEDSNEADWQAFDFEYCHQVRVLPFCLFFGALLFQLFLLAVGTGCCKDRPVGS